MIDLMKSILQTVCFLVLSRKYKLDQIILSYALIIEFISLKQQFYYLITLTKQTMEDQNMGSEVKINPSRNFTIEPDLDVSNDQIIQIRTQKSKNKLVLDPIKVDLTDLKRRKVQPQPETNNIQPQAYQAPSVYQQQQQYQPPPVYQQPQPSPQPQLSQQSFYQQPPPVYQQPQEPQQLLPVYQQPPVYQIPSGYQSQKQQPAPVYQQQPQNNLHAQTFSNFQTIASNQQSPPPRQRRQVSSQQKELNEKQVPITYEPHRTGGSFKQQTIAERQTSPRMTIEKPLNQSQRRKEADNASPTRLNKKIKKGYELANYNKALEYQNTQSYRIKMKGVDGEDIYEPMSVWGSNEELKQFGLGVYLYFQFLKRLTIALFLMSAVLIFALVVNYKGTSLDSYSSSGSFTMTLAKFSIGNLNDGDQTTYFIITATDILSMVILLFFWISWRSFHNSIIDQMQKDHKIVNPVNYVVTIEEFHDKTTNMKTLERQLKSYLDTLYKGTYEVQIVYNYLGNFDKFIAYDEKIEVVQKQFQIFKQTNKQSDNLVEAQTEVTKMEEQIQQLSQAFEPMYAFVHFRTLKAKMTFLNHCKHFRLQNTTSDAIQRAICCTPHPPERLLFLGKFPVMLRNSKLSRPEQINWRNIDISGLGRAVRWFFSFLVVVISILITSALIGFCTLYVASLSSCQSYVAPTGANFIIQISQIKALNSEKMTYCFCSANIASIYTDTNMEAYCGSLSNNILITNMLQVGASVLSSVTNVILGIIIGVVAKYLLRPNSIPKEYVFIFWGVLISNFINTGIIPLLLNSNIFGVEFVSYLKFINFMDFTQMSIFSDFTIDWYALISPYYVNFVIIGCFISPIIGLIVFSLKNCLNHWKLKSKCDSNDKENPLVQKQANKALTTQQFQYAAETSTIMLLLLIGVLYSGLLPLMIPILAIGFFWTFYFKKSMVLKYSIKIAADQSLNQSVINCIPFIILLHGLFSIWSHTSTGVFQTSAPILSFSWKIFNNGVDRVFNDIVMLALPVALAAIIIFDSTIITFFRSLRECCKDQLEVPIQWAAVQNQQFSDRVQKVNILGSYKLVNNPTYGHAMKAYNELSNRPKKDMQMTKDALNPELFM